MNPDEEIINQLQKINQRLDQLSNSRKIIVREFVSGIFRSFGSFLGTSIIILISIYFLSQINFGQTINDFIQKFVPKPVQINVPFSQLLPDQL